MDPVPDPTDGQREMLPPRLLRPHERALVTDWLAAAGDISLAYVSSRKGDDPAIYRRIVIVVERDEEPSYLISAPKGINVWMVYPYRPEQEALQFGSLQKA